MVTLENKDHICAVAVRRSAHFPGKAFSKGNKRLLHVNFRVAKILQVILAI
jgi:hypothetical protein